MISCSGSTDSWKSEKATFESTLRGPLDRIGAMGYFYNALISQSNAASFHVPRGARYLAEQYVSKAPTNTVVLELVMSNSAVTLAEIQRASIAEAIKEGFRRPVVDGNRFYLSVPIRPGSVTQKDWLGWIIPGTAVVVVHRWAHLPVSSDALRLLAALTAV